MLHSEITKNDKKVNEPILESRMIALVGSIEKTTKFSFYSGPDPLNLTKSSKNNKKSEI